MLLLLQFFIPASLQGQSLFSSSRYFNSDHGLPNSEVNVIAQSRDGILWIGTNGGLARFDGLKFQNFLFNPNDSSSIMDNRVRALITTPNEVWCGNYLGISILNTYNMTFRNIRLETLGILPRNLKSADIGVSAIKQDKQGTIWLGTRNGNLLSYDTSTKAFQFEVSCDETAKELPNAFETHHVLNIIQSPLNDSILWVGTIAGLMQWNKYTRQSQWHYFYHPNSLYQSHQNAFKELYADTDGKIYVGTWSAAIKVFDTYRNEYYDLPNLNRSNEVMTSPVQSILPLQKDKIIITTTAGVILYNKTTHRIERTRTNNPRTNQYYGANVIDSAGRIWLGSHLGMFYYDPLMQQFEYYNYSNLNKFQEGFSFLSHIEDNGRVATIFGRNVSGLFHLNLEDEQWSYTPVQLKDNKENPIGLNSRSLIEDNKGNVVIADLQHLYQYQPQTRTFSSIPLPSNIRTQRISSITIDNDGYFWICGGPDGIYRYRQGKPAMAMHKQWTPMFDTQTEVSWNQVKRDSKGHIWMITNYGYSVYFPESDALVQNLGNKRLPSMRYRINAIQEDQKGRMWMASDNAFIGYVSITNPAAGFQRLTSLPDSAEVGNLHAFTIASDGAVWCITRKGLCRIEPENLEPEFFRINYEPFHYDFFSISTLQDGRLLLGGRNSVTIIDPKNLRKNSEIPKPYIQTVTNSGKVYWQGKNGDTLNVNYDANAFSINYSAVAYSLSKEVRFRYRLKGLEKDWIEAGKSTQVTYNNVPGGEYDFELQAINSEGAESPVISAMHFSVSTAWWQTWWYRTFILLLGAGFIYGLYRYRIWQYKQNERVKTLYKRKMATVQMSALLAQMNPHFLFNSLNSIDSYIIKNETAKASEYLNNFARLMRLILNNSQYQSITLKDELETLDLYLQMESLRFRDKFHYSIVVDPEIATEDIDVPPMLIQPFVENAIWHGLMHKHDDETPQVSVALRLVNGSLEVSVEDNGIGRKQAAALRQQRNGRSKQSMGMRITTDRIELLNTQGNAPTSVEIKDLYHEDGSAAGTRVELNIPI